MDRLHESLEFKDTYESTITLMDQSLCSVERNCHELRDHIQEQTKLLGESIRTYSDDENKKKALQATVNFHKLIRTELTELEEICHAYRVNIRASLTSEIHLRLQPPSHTAFATFTKAFDLCRDTFIDLHENGQKSIPKVGISNWTNVSSYLLDSTQNIIHGPKRLMPSEFDDSDQKFKQELMVLRTKMFNKSDGNSREIIADDTRLSIGIATKKEFIVNVKKIAKFSLPSLDIEFAKVGSLKFVDGDFNVSDVWLRLLDAYGGQFRSKWYLVIGPQISRLLKKYKVPTIHLSPRSTFDYISKIPENGLGYIVSRSDLVPLVEIPAEALWLKSWSMQTRSIDGKDVAAIIIQTCWRGYKVRRTIFDAEAKYIAASIIWVAWIVVKNKRKMHERYLRNMLTSLATTRELSLKFSTEYNSITQNEHIVIHLPSIGFPLDIRRTFRSRDFATYQNSMSLKWSFVKNPDAEVIYVLPIKPTEDILEMYHDLIESVLPNENAQNRITFLELSQGDTFADCSFNVARTLYCSEDTLVDIKKRITNKPAFVLPWIMDECDVRIAGNLDIPLLAPDMEMQHQMLNRSYITKMIDELGLKQPPHVTNIKDYATLCDNLAEQICNHTEICSWLIKLNVGFSWMHTGIFLINHISVPFMPILRKERALHGDKWNYNLEIRMNFLKSLYEHLPQVVSTVTRFNDCYVDWKDFSTHMTRYGCLLQAVPNEKSSSSITVSLFVPRNATGGTAKWMGTADKLCIAKESQHSTFVYMMPQTSVDNAQLEPVVEKLTKSMQKIGYFGYLYVDLYCYPHAQEDKIEVLFVETNPYYGHGQHFADWMNLAIHGSYDRGSNSFDAGISVAPDIARQRSTTLMSSTRLPRWNETTKRYGIAVEQLYHPKFSNYSWKKLRALTRNSGIKWNSSTKQGATIVLHDGTRKNSAMMIAITSSMQSTLTMMKHCIKKLYLTFSTNRIKNSQSNLLEAIEFFATTSKTYKNLSMDKCDPFNMQ